MVNGSLAVIFSPSVSSFEEHERNNLGAALGYLTIASVISAIVLLLASWFLPTLNSVFSSQEGALDLLTFIGMVVGVVISGCLLWAGVFLVGRMMGGTGRFGEIAYDLALFTAPLAVIQTALGIIPVVGSLLTMPLSIYSLYLTYLAIQCGMNLPSSRAIYVCILLLVLTFGLTCGVLTLISRM